MSKQTHPSPNKEKKKIRSAKIPRNSEKKVNTKKESKEIKQQKQSEKKGRKKNSIVALIIVEMVILIAWLFLWYSMWNIMDQIPFFSNLWVDLLLFAISVIAIIAVVIYEFKGKIQTSEYV